MNTQPENEKECVLKLTAQKQLDLLVQIQTGILAGSSLEEGYEIDNGWLLANAAQILDGTIAYVQAGFVNRPEEFAETVARENATVQWIRPEPKQTTEPNEPHM